MTSPGLHMRECKDYGTPSRKRRLADLLAEVIATAVAGQKNEEGI